MELKNKSLKDLLELQDEIAEAIKNKRVEEKGNFLRKVDDLAKESGLSLEDITELFNKSKGKGILAPKYRNPDDPSKTWSGHGRKPAWFKERVEKGENMDDYLI